MWKDSPWGTAHLFMDFTDFGEDDEEYQYQERIGEIYPFRCWLERWTTAINPYAQPWWDRFQDYIEWNTLTT